MLDELVDELLQDGPPADLTSAVLSPFALAVTCELMGVPAADRQDLHTWSRLVLSSSPGAKAGERARDEMGAYFAGLIGARAGSTGEDVASLLGAAVGRGRITLDEAVELAVLLHIGGETVAGSSGQLLYLLLTRPDLTERLRTEPEMRPRAIDELLRSLPFAHDPNSHATFGFASQHCPGGMPARLEYELLIDAFLHRMPGLRLAVPPDQVPFRKGAIRSPETLPVVW
jgi:biflaviolin synthase